MGGLDRAKAHLKRATQIEAKFRLMAPLAVVGAGCLASAATGIQPTASRNAKLDSNRPD
jgi:hypothetical protein